MHAARQDPGAAYRAILVGLSCVGSYNSVYSIDSELSNASEGGDGHVQVFQVDTELSRLHLCSLASLGNACGGACTLFRVWPKSMSGRSFAGGGREVTPAGLRVAAQRAHRRGRLVGEDAAPHVGARMAAVAVALSVVSTRHRLVHRRCTLAACSSCWSALVVKAWG